MILVDTGPLVGLFDPRDGAHLSCARTLAGVREELVTTVPVLTEAFHLLDLVLVRDLDSPASTGFTDSLERSLTEALSAAFPSRNARVERETVGPALGP